MTRHEIDNLLVAAAPASRRSDTSFTKDVMKQIHHTNPTPRKRSWLARLQQRSHLHGPAFAALAIVIATLLCGVVYAAIHFAPDFIRIMQKQTNQRGQPEYTVSSFADCTTNIEPVDKFEVKKDTPTLSDEEIKKIIQARCELQWVSGFVKATWPHSEDSTTVTYARSEVVAQLKSVDESGVAITYQGGESQLNTLANHKLDVYTSGKKISVDDLKPGDAVFPVMRVSEKKIEHSNPSPDPRSRMSEQPHVLGMIGILKMSLPYEYYQKMQGYITEVRPCNGNETADCPATSYIDVYPRAGGEGATNTFFDKSLESAPFKEVTGTVTELAANSLKLKGSNGETYTIQLAENGFSDYNTLYAPAYNTPEAMVKPGSTVNVTYKQAGSSFSVNAAQILRITLLLEMTSPKKDAIKQY